MSDPSDPGPIGTEPREPWPMGPKRSKWMLLVGVAVCSAFLLGADELWAEGILLFLVVVLVWAFGVMHERYG